MFFIVRNPMTIIHSDGTGESNDQKSLKENNRLSVSRDNIPKYVPSVSHWKKYNIEEHSENEMESYDLWDYLANRNEVRETFVPTETEEFTDIYCEKDPKQISENEDILTRSLTMELTGGYYKELGNSTSLTESHNYSFSADSEELQLELDKILGRENCPNKDNTLESMEQVPDSLHADESDTSKLNEQVTDSHLNDWPCTSKSTEKVTDSCQTDSHETEKSTKVAPNSRKPERLDSQNPTKSRKRKNSLVDESHDDKHKCIFCFKGFRIPSQLAKHLKMHNKARTTCDICLEMVEMEKLDAHYLKFHTKERGFFIIED